MEIKRKLLSELVRERLESDMFDAEDFGHSFFEVRHVVSIKSTDTLMGIETVNPVMTRRPGSRDAVATGVRIITDGILTFYPDNRGRRWAYVLDTPSNREVFARQLACPFAIVEDKEMKKELVKLADKLGVVESKGASVDTSFANYVVKGGKTEKEILLEEIAELKKSKEELISAQKTKTTKQK